MFLPVERSVLRRSQRVKIKENYTDSQTFLASNQTFYSHASFHTIQLAAKIAAQSEIVDETPLIREPCFLFNLIFYSQN